MYKKIEVKMSSKFELHKRNMLNYYSNNPESLRIFIEIVKNRSTVVSLRLLDWFVTNYVNDTFPDDTPESKLQRQQLFFSYTQNLNSYKKVWFDPFARELPDKGSHKILFDTQNMTMECRIESEFETNSEHIIATTIGQLNFFRSAIEYGIINYVFEHREKIQAHMIAGLNTRKTQKANQKIYQPLVDECYPIKTNVTNVLDAFRNDPSVHVTFTGFS